VTETTVSSGIGAVTTCQGCAEHALETVIDFLPQPPVQAFLSPERLSQPETAYPLSLRRCSSCGLVQLGYVADPEVVFPRDYPYQTGMTRILVEVFGDLVDKAVDRYALTADDLAVDVGSNDGTLLKGYKRHGLRVLGVEPTDIARVAEANGIPTVQDYFSAAAGARIAAEHGEAAVISATNVLAHVPDVYDFLEGVASLLRDGGVFVSESHYLLDLVQKLQYDTIYHEHLRFYALRPLRDILSRAGFSVVDVERVPTHGGSIRVWAVKGSADAEPTVEQQLREEDGYGLHGAERLEDFRRRIVESKHGLLRTLLDLRGQGKRVVGIGAPARASMLLNYTKLDAELVEAIGEPPGSLKIGLHTPASHIPIVDEPTLLATQPDYALMLSWHIADELMPKLRERGFEGGFIVPLPEPKVIEAGA